MNEEAAEEMNTVGDSTLTAWLQQQAGTPDGETAPWLSISLVPGTDSAPGAGHRSRVIIRGWPPDFPHRPEVLLAGSMVPTEVRYMIESAQEALADMGERISNEAADDDLEGILLVDLRGVPPDQAPVRHQQESLSLTLLDLAARVTGGRAVARQAVVPSTLPVYGATLTLPGGEIIGGQWATTQRSACELLMPCLLAHPVMTNDRLAAREAYYSILREGFYLWPPPDPALWRERTER